MREKVKACLFFATTALMFVANINAAHAIPVNIEGVSQGVDDTTFTKDAPLANIVILQNIIEDPANSTYEIFDTHKGFRVLTPEEIDARSYTTDYLSDKPVDSPVLVYDESVEGARKITGNVDSMNTFSGKIAAFTYKDGALLPDGTRSDVVITYSDINLPLQTNFGQSPRIKDANDYSKYYSCDPNYSPKITAKFKEGYSCSDFWKYNETTGRGEYLKPAVYTIGYGRWMHAWNNLLSDASNSQYTTRYGIKMDVKIQVVDKAGKVVDGRFMFPLTDIDVRRSDTGDFKYLYNFGNEDGYAEAVRINSGVDKDSKIYIPGDIEGDDVKQYKYTEVTKTADGIKFTAKNSDGNDSIYSGFVTVIDNNTGVNMTFWSTGTQRLNVNSFLLRGQYFHRIISSSGPGGTIKTTSGGNPNGDLTDGSRIYGPGTVDVPDGKTVKYTMIADPGYTIKSVEVDGKMLTIPEVGKTSTIELDGPDGNKMIGTLINLGNGVYSFIFPDNNYDHKIHVEWEAVPYPEVPATGESKDTNIYLFTIVAGLLSIVYGIIYTSKYKITKD